MARVKQHSFRLPVLGWLLDGWRGIRRWLSSAEWSARLLRLERFESHDEQGLILVQIDGLSRYELEQAIASGTMPFLRQLIQREGHVLHTMYSGLPSTTPAVQGELFYGKRAAVPAFAFADRATGEIVRMLSPETAERVENLLVQDNPGLLAGGSGYSNIYTGGAAEPHFCATTLGWNGMFRSSNPISLLLAMVWNFDGLLRIVIRLMVELTLGIIDCLRGIFGKLSFKRERQALPARLLIGVVLQELMTMAACVDAARGLPIIQFNFLGYDEGGHLRGPASKFAHRKLRTIDRAIRRVWRAANRSHARNYALGVYSDHGQEPTLPYDDLAGRNIVEAVAMAFAHDKPPVALDVADLTRTRRSYLRARRKVKIVEHKAKLPSGGELMVAAIGPVGHVYLPQALTAGDVSAACQALCTVHQVPAVVRLVDETRLQVWTAEGEFEWPRDMEKVVGREHPFAAAIKDDLITLCKHPWAGDVVMLGWREGREPISFVREIGAHAGLAPRETGAFALLPSDMRVQSAQPSFLRPDELRVNALRFLRRCEGDHCKVPRATRGALRVVTYNVHSCVGLDGRLSPSRIARVLAQCDADVIALQELDVRRKRTGGIDQAQEIARHLDAEFTLFHPAITRADEQYGDAILSRLPLRLVRAALLPGEQVRAGLEPRGAIWAAVDVDGREVQIVNTHLGLLKEERRQQIDALLGSQWLGHSQCSGPAVLCGDFNFLPGSASHRQITAGFRDCQESLPGYRPRKTWFSPLPLARIDHVFMRGELEVTKVEVIRNQLTSVTSDHLPLVVDLRVVQRPL